MMMIIIIVIIVRIPWFQYPIIYDIRSRPRKIISPTGSKGISTLLDCIYCVNTVNNHLFTMNNLITVNYLFAYSFLFRFADGQHWPSCSSPS